LSENSQSDILPCDWSAVTHLVSSVQSWTLLWTFDMTLAPI